MRLGARSISPTKKGAEDDLLASDGKVKQEKESRNARNAEPVFKTRMDLLFLRKLKEEGHQVVHEPSLSKQLMYDWEIRAAHVREEMEKLTFNRKKGPRQIHRPERYRLEFERKEQEQRARYSGVRPTRE